VKGGIYVSHTNSNHKRSKVVVWILGKIDVQSKTIATDKEHYTLIRRSVPQEVITIMNIHASNIGLQITFTILEGEVV
jgi:hypothetical protein